MDEYDERKNRPPSGASETGSRAAISGGLTPLVLRRVLAYMDENLDKPVVLADLAKVAELSPYHFARSFAKSAGRPPLSHMRRLRIERAQSLLERSRSPLSVIARSCGFLSVSAFSAAFQAIVGQSPGAWRESRRSESAAQ